MTVPLTICTWLWPSPVGYRSHFTVAHVHALFAMVTRNLTVPHTLACVTDEQGLDPCVRRIPMPKVPKSSVRPGRPNCFRRLWSFSAEAKDAIGPRFLSLDLDCVVTADLTPLVKRVEDLVMWGDTARRVQYNGSMILHTPGTRTQVWTEFKGDESARKVMKSGLIGSDQAWITMVLGRNEARYTEKDGVYSFRNNIMKRPKKDLPDNARIVFFHGPGDPWDAKVQRQYPWIKEHYR